MFSLSVSVLAKKDTSFLNARNSAIITANVWQSHCQAVTTNDTAQHRLDGVGPKQLRMGAHVLV